MGGTDYSMPGAPGACTRRRGVELLAPAGDATCLHAAVGAGADAVYLGLSEFNARRNAGNFSPETLAEACRYAHLRGTAVYVALNVEVLPGELDRAVAAARAAWEAGVDAAIVQDVGLAAELGRALPDLPLHVSTQMNVHSAAGVEAAWRLGATRVTLARELGLAEVAELSQVARDFGMETEVFVHGALCICYSGQCLMSSLIGGRSANRGLCAQACRLPYELHVREGEGDGAVEGSGSRALPAEGDHLLSPRDLCLADRLEDLVAAGVASLKIEGRMKSPDYVHEVVSVYRAVLDAKEPASEAQRARLEEAFSRGFTEGYLAGERGNALMSYGRPNNRGVFVGRVARAGEGFLELAPTCDLHGGDILEVWTNRGHFTVPVDRDAPAGAAVRLATDQRASKSDRAYRVRNASAAFHDEPEAPRVPVRGRVELKLGAPAHAAFEAALPGRARERGEATGPVVEPARTRPLEEAAVRDHVGRLGTTPFTLEALDVALDEGAGMGFSQLHHLRAEALADLEAQLLAPWAGRAGAGADAHAGGRTFTARRGGSRERICHVAAWCTNPSAARAARKAGADAVYVPLLNFKRGQAAEAGVRQDSPAQAGYPKQCVMALPTVEHDPVPGTREYGEPFDMWDYVRPGKPVFADSLGSALRALNEGAQVEVGPHVPAVNAAALQLLADWGAARVWLSPEITLGQVDELARTAPLPLGITVSGAQELMVCEHCLLMSQGPCAQECPTCPRRARAHFLRDRKGFEFPVATDMLGRSHLYNGVELDAVASLVDLVDMGISAVMVDTTLMDARTAAEAVRRTVRARDLAVSERRAVAKRPGTTTGHLFRGVQ